MATRKSNLEEAAQKATSRRKTAADTFVSPEPEKRTEQKEKAEKHTYSYRISDNVAMRWKAYSEAKNDVKIGELTEKALISYMEDNPLSTDEQRLYGYEMSKLTQKKMK